MFVDEATLLVRAGKGGDGSTSFRREKFVSKGGPDGGDGGSGGSVIVRADNNVNTLAKFRHQKQISAKNGENGKRRKAHGANGEDIEVVVPVGTVLYEGEEVVADLKDIDSQAVLAKGGRGGFGNAHFVSSVRQAPRMAEIGEPGEERELRMELKSVADVGLVGLPNAGKSTLLSVISNARPRIADYPFTTLVPNLGVVDVYESSMIVADIPGLIEGASQGKGLGDEFLRHIERTKVLLHLVDAGADDPVADYKTIQAELSSYAVDLSQKPQIVALSKTDIVPSEIIEEHKKQLEEVGEGKVHVLSSVAHQGLEELLKELHRVVEKAREEEIEEQAEEEMPVLRIENDPRAWRIEKEKGEFVVYGEQIEGFARRTDMSSREAVARLMDILKRRGVIRELHKLGATHDDVVRIAGKQIQI